MKDKTAMQQMLEWTRKTFPMDLDTPRMIEDKIESLLKVEKEQMEESYNEGQDFSTYVTDEIYGGVEYWEREPMAFEQYYKEKYGE